MKLIPNIPYSNESHAEQKVFKAFKDACITEKNFVAFHSILIPNHAYKRVGEADFVIVCHYGIFVLEIKGGRISHNNGEWFSENKQGKYNILNPFKQANSAVHALMQKITYSLSLESARIPLGYGVIFPDVAFTSEGAEWDEEQICDCEDMRSFEDWLYSFFDYWHSRPKNNKFLSEKDVTKIIEFLRPDFDFVQPLFSQIQDIKNYTVTLTQEQYHYVDMAMDNKRIICSGGAGTGKTFLAAELCRRFSKQGKKILLACHSSWLRHYLSTLIKKENIVISTVSGIDLTIQREGIDSFDILVVDEGQDVLNKKELEVLDRAVTGGFENGQWYFFHDMNNQANLISKLDINALDWLKTKNNPAIFKLNINCRNTNNILSKIQSSLMCDMGKPTISEGPEVTEFFGNRHTLCQHLSNLLKELILLNIEKGSITILSAVPRNESLLSSLHADKLRNIISLDEYKVRNYPFSGITFSEIGNFKGLENDVIILLDLPPPKDIKNIDKKSLYYVGMSRARAKLYCLWEIEE